MYPKHWPILIVSVLLLLTACAAPTPAPSEPRVLRVMTHDSFSVSEDVIVAFENAHNAKVQFLQAGDAGTLVNQAILTVDNPQADVLYGVDNTFLSRALAAGIFEPYRPANLSAVPADLRLDDAQARVTPVDYGDVCLNYDQAYFAEHNLALPQSLADLRRPEYRDLLVIENPASSSPGLAFMFAAATEADAAAFTDFWRTLRDNGLRVVNDWESAYYGEFSGGSGSEGIRPLVVSYATSPAAEVYFSEGALTAPPTSAIVAPGTCFRQIEFAGILKNGQHRDLAEAFLDFLLSDAFQNDIPLQMWVFPVMPTATLPPVFRDFALQAEKPVTVSPEFIEQNREAWIELWTNTVLR